MTPNTGTIHERLRAVIAWAATAAKAEVSDARFFNREPDSDYGMGLWQSFQTEFPKLDGQDYDILCNALNATYTATVNLLAEATAPCSTCGCQQFACVKCGA